MLSSLHDRGLLRVGDEFSIVHVSDSDIEIVFETGLLYEKTDSMRSQD